MSDFRNSDTIAHTVAERARIAPRRKAPKSAEQLLAEAEKRTGILRAKVIANRDRLRMELIDDLYAKYGVDAVHDDRSEQKRLATLRAKLGL
jgi:hypothetical protein